VATAVLAGGISRILVLYLRRSSVFAGSKSGGREPHSEIEAAENSLRSRR